MRFAIADDSTMPLLSRTVVKDSWRLPRQRPGSLCGRSFKVRSMVVALLPMVVLLVWRYAQMVSKLRCTGWLRSKRKFMRAIT